MAYYLLSKEKDSPQIIQILLNLLPRHLLKGLDCFISMQWFL